ncbi:MAG: RdgB/HAM1 family non-canonical purine NTP pyrophosphatase [Phycisphaerales bacterium]
MSTQDPIVLATGNPKKVVELREIMAEIGVGIIPLTDLGMDLEEPEENGTTFEENARLKAIGYAKQTGRHCLADDSGLVVDSLGGAPGVISARYSNDIDPSDLPRAERDRLNNKKLLNEMGDRDLADRQARFVCAMCLAGPDDQGENRVLAESIGTFEGAIGKRGDVPRGENGFGYDPLFLVAPENVRTSAELESEEKHRLSHRGAASRIMMEHVRTLGLGQ